MPRLLLFLCFFTGSVRCQIPELMWAKGFFENNVSNPSVYSNGRSVAVDAQGNVYSVGIFNESVDFDPGPGVFTMVGGDQFHNGIYLSKLDRDGNFAWAVQVPTSLEFGQMEVKIDSDGNVYLASDIMSTVDMDPGPGVLTMSPTGGRDVFVAKYSPAGNLIWAKQFGGPGDTIGNFTSFDIDPDNNLIIAGIFNNTQDFDPGPGVYNMTSTAHMQSFIVKLSGNGNFIWARQFGNSLVVSSGSKIAELRTDPKGNILMTGSFSGTCDFDPGTGSFMMTNSSGSSSDGYFCKLDRDGNFVWAKSIGQTGGYNHYVLPYGMDIDGSGSMIITGTFIGNYDFDPGPGTSFVFANPGDCFILKLDGNGDFVWVKTMGNEEFDMGIDLVIDSEDNIYVAASLSMGVDLDPGPGQHIFNGAESGAAPIIKFDPAGNFVYAAPFRGVNGGNASFRRMAIDPERNIYVTGTLYGIADFDPGPGVYEMDALYDQAPFVFKLGHCKNITRSTLDIIACSNYTLNNTTYDSSGTYTQTLMNTSGCDS
ncbi:MAG: hypothetical protein ABW174_14005, partial [Flavitalea sp.]